jgi:hypothetical protein
MKLNSEQEVDRILRALGAVESSAGMQQRVMAVVSQRETDVPSRRIAWRWAAVGVVGFVAAIFAVRLRPHPLPSRPPARASAEAAPALVRPMPLALDSLDSVAATRKRSLHTDAKGPHPLLCDCDPTALAEANAPSQPAPELPLTDQEKLLRQVARHPDPVQVAELNAATREAHMAMEKDDFEAFFTPPANVPAPE